MTIAHEPRRASDYIAAPASTGPMGLRCLHPVEPGTLLRIPEDTPIAYRDYSPARALEDLRTCAFEGCVCVCHSAAESP